MVAPTRVKLRKRRSADARPGVLGRATLGLALLASSLSACNAGGSSGAAHAVSEHPLLGAAAPALDLPGPDGKGKVSLPGHAGKIVIVDFWATWCEPCRQSFPAYQKLVDDFGGKLVVIGVSVDESPTPVRGFVRATGVSFPIAWDEGQAAAQSYQPPKMPTSFIVDASGIVRFVHAGFSPGDENELKGYVKSLL
jgi:cytochrome c biogenesis protein CcmG, thiol:disulfide interchange protein DsbE